MAQKRLTDKQLQAIEMLTSGNGYTYKYICETIGIDGKTLWSWRNAPSFSLFQEELDRVDKERWLATVDAAREGALKLCQKGNQKMIEFVLKNEGYNPTQKVEADLNNEIVINVGED